MELNLIPQLLLLQNPIGIIRKWSDEDNQLFIKLYPHTNNRILAVKFKRSISSIKNRANILNVHKADDYNDVSKFTKGSKPWNKGLKGIFFGGKKTQYKKGNAPTNTKLIGTKSIRYDKDRPYKYIKIENHKWELLHRFNWAKINGPIPEGFNLRCIDENTLNCNSNNWKLITQRENIIKNLNRAKAGKSLSKTRRSEKARVYIGLEQKTNLKIK